MAQTAKSVTHQHTRRAPRAAQRLGEPRLTLCSALCFVGRWIILPFAPLRWDGSAFSTSPQRECAQRQPWACHWGSHQTPWSDGVLILPGLTGRELPILVTLTAAM